MMISSRILLLWLSLACCALLSGAIGPVESLSSRQLGMFAFCQQQSELYMALTKWRYTLSIYFVACFFPSSRGSAR
jgi:hypothetical protein